MDDRDTFRPPRQPLVPPGGADLHTRDMTATFAADVTLGAAQARLREHNQWLPIDGDEAATLGHLIDTNSTGPLRLGYGAWRDLLLGVQFTNGRGELITAGGRTVKNVAGYDLTKFMVGAWGAFGKLVTLTTRTYRRPPGALLATAADDSHDFGSAAIQKLMPTPCRPHWILYADASLHLGYFGDERALSYYESALQRFNPSPLLWLKVRRQSVDQDVALRAALWSKHRPDPTQPERLAFRASMPPARLRELFNPALDDVEWAADPAFGIVVGACGKNRARSVASLIASTGGTALLYAPDGVPINLSPNPVTLRVLKRLKAAFDPDNHLPPLPVEQT